MYYNVLQLNSRRLSKRILMAKTKHNLNLKIQMLAGNEANTFLKISLNISLIFNSVQCLYIFFFVLVESKFIFFVRMQSIFKNHILFYGIDACSKQKISVRKIFCHLKYLTPEPDRRSRPRLLFIFLLQNFRSRNFNFSTGYRKTHALILVFSYIHVSRITFYDSIDLFCEK